MAFLLQLKARTLVELYVQMHVMLPDLMQGVAREADVIGSWRPSVTPRDA